MADSALHHGNGETLLLVEDEAPILRMSRDILTRLGYSVLAAATPSQAVGLARAHSGEIDLLITDVVMPEMNGRQLAEQLNRIKPGLRCLYMSGYAESVIAHHGVLEPSVRFIQKPFTMRELAEGVRSALDAGRHPR